MRTIGKRPKLPALPPPSKWTATHNEDPSRTMTVTARNKPDAYLMASRAIGCSPHDLTVTMKPEKSS